MEQAILTSGEPNPLDTTGLCLLSLDGGGVRGLSTLYILKSIMDRLNGERKKNNLPLVKPCEVFDLIGGTSTGGLIAIMLGRLEMDVDQCIAAYTELAEAVFGEKRSSIPFNRKGRVKARFDSAKLEKAVQKVIVGTNTPETELFDNGTERGCRTFVCTVDSDTKDIVRIRSYSLPDQPNIRATICQAALATSAATTFFEPVSIGHRTFADGGFGANNPVDEVEGEASNIWCSETGDLKPLVKCFISIGTGNPEKKAFEDSIIKFLGQTVVEIATETEKTEKNFIARWAKHFDEKRFYRFNVEQGLQSIGLDEYRKRGPIEAATEGYLTHMAQRLRVRDCIQNLKLKQNKAATYLSYLVNEYVVQRMLELKITHRLEAPWIVPFQRNLSFVGRTSEVAQVDAILSSDIRCERVAIIGLGGIGKTQIALEYVYRTRERKPDCSVFWIPVTNVESMLEAYLEIGRQLQIPNIEREPANAPKLVQRWLSQESSGKWLLVFDNADDIDFWTDQASTTIGLNRRISQLPRSKHGSIIFTTRSRDAAVKLASNNVVLVGEINDTTAKDLLQKSLIDQDVLADDGAAANLLQKLSYLPLAIVQAVAYINKNQISLSQYTALLDDTEQNIIDILSEDFEDEGRYDVVKNPIATTWLISFEQIRTRNALAAEYLSFMSCVDAKDIPRSLLPPAQSTKMAIDAIGMLSGYSFITIHKTGQLMDLHRLVHLATRNWLRTSGALRQWAAKALERLEEVFPDSDHTKRSLWRMYLPHARYALETEMGEVELEGARDDVTKLLWKFGNCTYHDGRYKEAEMAFAQVMETRKTKLGADHPDTLSSMANLASTYLNQGRWDAAEELFVQVVETRKTKLGADHLETLNSMANLASTYWNQGRWDVAEELFVQVVETRKTKLGADHLETLNSMANLASTYLKQGRWDAAEELFVQVVETSKIELGADYLVTLTSMANLASTYLNQGRWDVAEELFVQVVETRKTKLGADHPETLNSMANLASTYLNQGRWDVAEELFVQVVETRKTKLGADHPETLNSMANLASTYLKQGRWDAAEELFVQVVETSKTKLRADHLDTLRSMNNLASTYSNQGRWDAAEELFVQVVETSKTKLGADHPDTLNSMANLASTYLNQGRWDAAEELFVQVVETSKTKLGADHPETLTSMHNLAFTWKRLGRDNDALKLMEECVIKLDRTIGADHPDTLSSRAALHEWRQEEIDTNASKDKGF